ncbi:MAG: sigma-70 family RNA polymerase sigma factor [Bacteroidales bacterium]|nr:sigma-70 family RNA polymerase sigma factor [Bacteroidales bacterium]
MTTEENKTIFTRQDDLIAFTYEKSRPMITGYICKRIGDRAEAEDMTQEVFCRLLECGYFLNEDTILHLILSIARNLVIDWLRRHARKDAARDYFFVHSATASSRTEEEIAARELESMERRAVAKLSSRRQQVYRLCAVYGHSAKNVALNLGLSKRTVENHLFAARACVRASVAI